ncbi:MAG: hypothetical protein K1X53_13030 [Candidatus Sumerlaeaceae bacterium]|nr:hypothetical protein [Candidatus Sumerlaeaceae bacterium]
MRLRIGLLLAGVALSAALASAQTPALITSWTTQTAIYPTGFAAQMHGAVYSGDSIYVFGGNNATDGDTRKSWRLRVNKYNGQIYQSDALTDLPANGTQRYAYINAQTVTTNSVVYIAGGGWNTGGPNRNVTTIVKINNGTGVIDTITTSLFPSPYDPELGGAAITSAGYFYAWAGDSQSGTPVTYDTCVVAKIQPNGDLGAFSTTLPVPDPDATGLTGWWFPSACSVGNYVISGVGIPNSSQLNADAINKVYVASTNPATGAITSWTEQTTAPLPINLYGAELVAVNDTVFCIAGRTNGGAAQNVVYRSTFNTSTGTLGPWTIVDAQLPSATHYQEALYSPDSRSIYVLAPRTPATGTTPQNQVFISSPLFPRDPIPLAAEKEWSLYE